MKVCKSECIDFRQKEIDFSRCINCFNCFKSCPENGISYKFQPGIRRSDLFIPAKAQRQEENKSENDYLIPLKIQGENVPDPEGLAYERKNSRRSFLKIFLTGSAVLTGFFSAKKIVAAEEKGVSEYPVLPPGSVSIWNYTSNCTACHLCVSVCPTKVLQPTFTEFGLSGVFLPKMDFHTNFCNFECTLCTEICPTGAIYPVSKEQKSTLQIGVSKFIKNICIPVARHTTCGACSEHCPTKAVEMVPYLGNLKIPRINEKICIGCGACEYACPTKPDKAIYVEANLYHRKAMKPLKRTDQKIKVSKPEDDFPF
jgi:ferredoxin-type protein NapF